MTVGPVTSLSLAAVDVSGWIDPDVEWTPPQGDIGGIVETASITLVDPSGDIPLVPAYGQEALLKDVSAQLVFGGWLANPIDVPVTGVRRWTLHFVSWAARLAETATGLLNKNGVVDTDRNFIIAVLRDGLQARSFGSDSVGIDDPILVANEAVNWEGIEETATLAGTDWSYRQTLDVVRDIIGRVPGASLRLRADKIVESGRRRRDAPFVLAAFPSAARIAPGKVAEILAGTYDEDRVTAGHFNRVRLGGLGAAEQIAYDQVSHGIFGRFLDRPYENDESIAAVDLEREAYARLDLAKVRRVVRATITDDGIEVGQTVRVCFDEEGPLDNDIPFFEQFGFASPTAEDEPVDAFRGEFVVQKVIPSRIAPTVQGYELELGDYLPELDRALSVKIGDTGETP